MYVFVVRAWIFFLLFHLLLSSPNPPPSSAGLYFCWGVAYSLLTFCRSVTYYFATLEASKALHNMLIHHVLNLPMAFFDTNPSGRVVNRFSRDVEIMDSVLPASVIQFLGCFANLLTTFFLLCIAMPYFTIAFVPLMVFYIVLQVRK